MKTVLIVYYSRGGHTARIARTIGQTLIAQGNQADVMDIIEADHEGLDWGKYDLFIVGAPVHYGRYNRRFMNFVNRYRENLNAKPHSFFNVTGIARNSKAAQPDGNPYMQKFLKTAAWQPKHITCFAGKIDYPHYGWLDQRLIQMIMKVSGGPTQLNQSFDFTDWDDVKTYTHHCQSLV